MRSTGAPMVKNRRWVTSQPSRTLEANVCDRGRIRQMLVERDVQLPVGDGAGPRRRDRVDARRIIRRAGRDDQHPRARRRRASGSPSATEGSRRGGSFSPSFCDRVVPAGRRRRPRTPEGVKSGGVTSCRPCRRPYRPCRRRPCRPCRRRERRRGRRACLRHRRRRSCRPSGRRRR